MAGLVNVSLKTVVWKRNGRRITTTRAQEAVDLPDGFLGEKASMALVRLARILGNFYHFDRNPVLHSLPSPSIEMAL